jgi:nucleoside-diphosphate-sugar epimerase
MLKVWLFSFQPQDAYGLEKLATEELCKHYTKDFGIECRIGRFHNIYGPFGTWKGNVPQWNSMYVTHYFSFTVFLSFVSMVLSRASYFHDETFFCS